MKEKHENDHFNNSKKIFIHAGSLISLLLSVLIFTGCSSSSSGSPKRIMRSDRTEKDTAVTASAEEDVSSTILCQIVDNGTGSSIPNAAVEIKSSAGGGVRSSVTDKDGNLDIYLPDGEYTMTVKADGYGDCTKTIKIRNGKADGLGGSIKMEARKSFKVTLRDSKVYETYSYNNGEYYYTFDSVFPQFEYADPSCSKQQEKLNSYFLEEQADVNAAEHRGNRSKYKVIDRSLIEDILKENSMKNTFTEHEYTVQQMTEQFCSLAVFGCDYNGGAHGYNWRIGYVIDLSDGTALSLSDLFNNIDDFRNYAADYFYKEYADPNSTLPKWSFDRLYENIDDKEGSNWYIKDDELCVFYGEDVLGYHAEGTQLFSIPLSLCGDYWNERASEFFKHITPKEKPNTPDKSVADNNAPIYIGKVITKEDPLNVRKSPSIKSDVIGTVPKGSSIEIYSESDGWCEIRYKGGTGYVSKEYIAHDGDS